MPHIVTGRCVDCRYTYCVVECPVTCFYEVKDPHMLVIDPDTCIDCEACVPACPINAIYPDHELPEQFAEWEQKNADLFGDGENVTDGADPLPTAKLLDELQAEEQAKGFTVEEPSKAAS